MKILQIHNEYIFYGGEDTVVANERNLLEMNGHIVHQLIRKNDRLIIQSPIFILSAKNKTY